jgi:hypothetical protein
MQGINRGIVLEDARGTFAVLSAVFAASFTSSCNLHCSLRKSARDRARAARCAGAAPGRGEAGQIAGIQRAGSVMIQCPCSSP